MDSSCDFYFNQKSDLGFMAGEDFAEGAGFGDDEKSKNFDDSVSCSSDSLSSVVSSIASGSSMQDIEEGEEEEVSSSSSSSSNGPLQDMSPLLQQLPFKRGLSKHYQGKSQSFTSLAKVLSVEDLIKPENPYNKKLKSCRSYACGLSDQNNQGRRSSPPSSFSRIISKKASRGSCFVQMNAKRSSGFRPPMPPHRSTSTNSISNQTALFA